MIPPATYPKVLLRSEQSDGTRVGPPDGER